MAGWISSPDSLAARVRQDLARPSIRVLLSQPERAAFGLTSDEPEPGATPAVNTLQAKLAASGRMPSFRTAEGYPPELVASTLAVTGCDVKGSATQRSGGGAADVTFRDDGRIASVSVIDTRLSRACADAALTLLANYAGSGDRRVQRELIMIPFLTDYLACAAGRTTVQTPQRVTSGRIQAPKKIKDVKPVYPQSAQADGVSGVVILESIISTAGCVTDAKVVASADARLDWEALRAVLQWQFTPTLLDGKPTPIIMSVTVNFLLN